MGAVIRRWSSPLVAIVAIVALAIPSAAGAATTTPMGVNLLKDASAEQAAGTDGTTVVPVPGWTTQNGFTAAAYGALNCPTLDESVRIGGGTQMFFGGGQAVARARQTVAIKGRAAAIDAGRIRVRVSAWIAGYDGQGDNGRVLVRFLRANGTQVGKVRTVAVGATNQVMQKVSATKLLPAGTRSVEVVLIATRMVGAWNDAFFDKVDLRITKP
jgi:hypothetical protein